MNLDHLKGVSVMHHYSDGQIIDMRPFFRWFLMLPLKAVS